MKQVTKVHFDYFCKRVDYFMCEFGITGWTVFFLHQRLDASAEIRYTYDERAVTFALARSIHENPTKKKLNEIAFHEVIHLVLAPLDSLAKRRFVEEREICDAVEGMTCRLTKFFTVCRKK